MNRILYGPEESDNLAEGTQSLGEYCIQNLRLYSSTTILINEDTNEKILAGELLQQSIRIAECLANYGIKSGSKVGICSENRTEYCYLIFGTILLGATVTPISSFFSEYEMNHSIELSQPDVIFISNSTSAKILNIVQKHSCVKMIISFDKDNNTNHQTFAEFLNNNKIPRNDHFNCEPQDVKSNVAIILASSGTTGPSKGAELTQWNLFSTISNFPSGTELTFLTPSPLSYMSGFLTTFISITKGITCVMLSKFDPHNYLSCIQKYQLPMAFFNQSILNFVAKNPLASKYDLSSLGLIFYSGATLAKSQYEALKDKYPEKMIVQSYNLTETGYITRLELNVSPPNSVGVLQSSVQAVIVDPETEMHLGPLEPGEIRIKSNRVMKGYVGNPEATKQAFDVNGFFKTGDIGYYNENGEFFIVDRMKELIKYYGKKVHPTEIESVLLSHPLVIDTCVVGLPDESAGELPLAFVVTTEPMLEAEIIEYVADHLSSPQHLYGGVIFIHEISTTSSGSGKTYRQTLKELAIKIKNLN